MRLVQRLLFDGPLGLVTARIMANRNADAEREAIEVLAPAPADAVLAVGFGPGLGIAELLPKVGSVGGVDPAWVMTRLAARRNADAVRAGRLRVHRGTAADLPWPDDTFDGAIAVNSLQLWDPLAGSAAEVARVLRPGGRLVTLTHDWVVDDADDWLARTTEVLTGNGFRDVERWRAAAEDGRSLALVATAGGVAKADH